MSKITILTIKTNLPEKCVPQIGAAMKILWWVIFANLKLKLKLGFSLRNFIGLNRYTKKIQNVPLGVVLYLDNPDECIHKCLANER
jgi:hypothetical protein